MSSFNNKTYEWEEGRIYPGDDWLNKYQGKNLERKNISWLKKLKKFLTNVNKNRHN